MYILRTSKHLNGKSSQKPDGMMVRADGWFTDNKASALLFNTPGEAVNHYNIVLVPLWGTNGAGAAKTDLFVVEVEVKYVVNKVLKDVVATM